MSLLFPFDGKGCAERQVSGRVAEVGRGRRPAHGRNVTGGCRFLIKRPIDESSGESGSSLLGGAAQWSIEGPGLANGPGFSRGWVGRRWATSGVWMLSSSKAKQASQVSPTRDCGRQPIP